MLSLTSLLILQIVAAVSCSTSLDDKDSIVVETSSAGHGADAMSLEDEEIAISLLQTDVVIAPKSDHGVGSRCSSKVSSLEDSGTLVTMLRTMWRWVTQADASTKDATEAAKRFHKDFIAAALLMTCVLPWSRPSSTQEAVDQAAHQRFARMLPSGQHLRYLCVLLLFLKHYCIGSHLLLDSLFVILGATFDFAEMHSVREDDMWKKLGEFVPERFARLYPLYNLLVIGCYLIFFSSPCNSIDTLMGGNLVLSYSCALGAWLLSVVFGCYLVTIVMSTPPQQSQSSNVAIICAGCVAMVVLPRTLAAPVHGPWVWSDDTSSSMYSNAHSAGYQMFFSRRSLLLGLAHYFLGLVLARMRLTVKSGSFLCKREVGDTDGMVQDCQPASKADSDKCHAVKPDTASQWKEFEDEAQQDILRSLSVS